MWYLFGMSDESCRTKSADVGPHIFGRPPGLIAIITYEAALGLFQAVSGVLIFFSYRLISGELIEDPQDRFLNLLISHFSYNSSIKLGALLIVLGLTKLALAVGLFFNAKVTRVIGLLFFGGVAVFGIYHLTLRFSAFELFVLAIDMFILWYFWRVLPKHYCDKGMA